jgi:hypothetical protein
MLGIMLLQTFPPEERIYSSSPFSMRLTMGINFSMTSSPKDSSSLSSVSLAEATSGTLSVESGEETLSSDDDDDDDDDE